MKKRLFLSLLLTTAFSITSLFASQFPSAIDTYKALNETEPFVLSFGTSMTQTRETDNAANPKNMRQRLQELAAKNTNPRTYLGNPDRIGYVLRALPHVRCSNCKKDIDPIKLDMQTDKTLIAVLLDDAANNISENQLTLKKCPNCDHGTLIEQPRPEIKLTSAHRQTIIDQINHLGVNKQAACTKHGQPNYRLSLDYGNLNEQAQLVNQIGNVLLCGDHYTNPQNKADLFEKPEHSVWFANRCAEMIKLCPQVTHVCPISQPVARSQRITRGTLPPFACSISQKEYLKNINEAQLAAAQAMKEVNPNLKVLISHQWKPMHPFHGMLSPWYALECLICKIADKIYNGSFVSLMKGHEDEFDGLALSVYPALKFNGWIPQGDNTAANFNADDALEGIMSMHKAFPTKDIYIIETGCNTDDADKKKAFIDMTLYVCKLAREQGAPVKGVYFWGHTNDPEFYMEWNKLPGATHFGPFDELNPTNPCGSINAAGLYIKEILSKQKP